MSEPLSAIVKAGRLIRLQGWINLFFTIICGAAIVFPDVVKNEPMQASFRLLFLMYLSLSLPLLVIGSGVKQNKVWAKVLGAIVSVLSLVIFPIGTVLGAITIFYLAKGWGDEVRHEPHLTTSPPMGKSMVRLKLNLAVLLVIQTLVVLWIAAQGISAVLHGSLRPERLVWALIIIVVLFVACVVLSFRRWRVHPRWLWMLPPALFLTAYASLVAVDPGATWATRVTRDSDLAAENSFVPVGGGPIGIALAEGSIWLADRKGNSVVRVDPDQMRVIEPRIAAGRGSQFLAAGVGALWVSNQTDNSVSYIDLKTYQTATVRVGNGPTGIVVDAGAVWVANYDDNSVSRIDPVTKAATANVAVGKNPGAIAAGFGSVWVSNYGDGTVSRIDPSANRVTATIAVGKDPVCIAAGYGAVWVTDTGDGSLSRIDPERNVVSTIIPVGKSLLGVAVGEGFVWAVDNGESALYRIDPGTNQVVGQPIRLGRAHENPQFVIVGKRTIWVSNYNGSLQRVRLLDAAK